MALIFETDGGEATLAALGIIVLQNDETLEAEFCTIFNHPGVALYHSRIPSSAEVSRSTLLQMEHALPKAAGLLPNARPLDVIGYGCTSGATVIGADKVATLIQTKHPNTKVTDPITAVLAACRHLGVSKIGLVTPYIATVSQAMRNLLEDHQCTISGFGSFEQAEESVVARISNRSLFNAICKVGKSDDVEIVFTSCTNLRSFRIIEMAEAAIGKPVISSNQALAWHMIKLAGLSDKMTGPGRLFNS